jgi:chloride channel 7
VIYFCLAVTTAGLSLASGLFIPNMIIGACIGRVIGEVVKLCFPVTGDPNTIPGINPSIYAMIGAASMVAGSLRLVLSISVVLIELTGNTSYLLPLILTTLISKWIGKNLSFF